MNENAEARRAEWLRQEGVDSGYVPDRVREEIHRMVMLQDRRVRRAKWAAVVAWSVLLAVLICTGIAESITGRTPLTGALVVICMALLWISVVLSVSFYVRWVALRFRRLDASLCQIQELVEEMKRESSQQQI